MSDIFNTVLAQAAGITSQHPLAETLARRGNIVELTESSHDAVLRPESPGGFSHSERAALACRIARLNQESVLAQHFEGLTGGGESTEARSIADPSFDGGDNQRLRAVLRHTDLVTVNPKETTGADVAALKAAGVTDEDIVRLSEIIAYVSYLIRAVQGLRLMAEVV